MDNGGQAVEPQIILDLHRDLFKEFDGFTVHPTSVGRWRSCAGRLYEEQVISYEVAIPEQKVPGLRNAVCRLGKRIGQLAMYFDAPAPSVEIIDLSDLSTPDALTGGMSNEPKPKKTASKRSKRDRPTS